VDRGEEELPSYFAQIIAEASCRSAKRNDSRART
jgi:hypothetical protein